MGRRRAFEAAGALQDEAAFRVFTNHAGAGRPEGLLHAGQVRFGHERHDLAPPGGRKRAQGFDLVKGQSPIGRRITMGRNADAIVCLEKAAAALESDFWALGMAIQCYEAVGDREGMKSAARRELARVEKVIVIEPDHGLAIGWGVSALVALGEADRAREWTERAMLLDPDNINLLYNLGCNMVSLRDFDRALELLAPVFARAQHQNLLWFKRDTSLDPVRSDTRYQAMERAAEARLATSASE